MALACLNCLPLLLVTMENNTHTKAEARVAPIRDEEIQAALDKFPHDEEAHSALSSREYLALRLNQLRSMKIPQRRVAAACGVHQFTLSHLRSEHGRKVGKPVATQDAGVGTAIILHTGTHGFINLRYFNKQAYDLVKNIDI